MAKGKQQRLEGTEDQLIKEVVNAAEEYEDIRDQRMDLTKQESKLQERLLDVMKKHNLTEYEFEGKRVVVVPGKEKVRVRTADSEEPDEVEVEVEAGVTE